MNQRLIQEIRQRARDQCEYCRIPFRYYCLPFQVDHIIARQHQGATTLANLALACSHCNRHKGPNIAGRDPVLGDVVRLFHPRTDNWAEHFRLEGATIVGLTPVGRATIDVLAMNAPEFLRAREALIVEGVYAV